MSQTITAIAFFGMAVLQTAVGQNEFPYPACAQLKETLGLKAPSNYVPKLCHLQEGCLTVDWRIASEQPLTTTLALMPLTEKLPLKIRTVNVNLVHYRVEWSHRAEKQQAFETISKLFDSVLPVLSAAGFGVLSNRENNWRRAVEETDLCLSSALADLSGPVIDTDGSYRKRRLLHATYDLLGQAIPKLNELRLEALKGDNMDVYHKVSA